MAVYPWVAGDWHGVDVGKYPNFRRWRDAIASRPAVVKGMAAP
jgi:GST-like protein